MTLRKAVIIFYNKLKHSFQKHSFQNCKQVISKRGLKWKNLKSKKSILILAELI